jgi:hypothetical protein
MLTLKSLHLPIAMKAVLLIVALGLLSVAANVSCLERLDALDKLNAVGDTAFSAGFRSQGGDRVRRRDP